jgi:uncharacterized membrane protein YkoI
MNSKDLTKNRGLFAIILSVAVIATAGGLSVVYAATDSNQIQNQTQPQIQGSIHLQQNIMSNVKTSFSAAQNTAASSVTNGKVIGGFLTVIQGSVVYAFKVIDDKNLFYSVIVDAGNGKVLYTSPGQTMNFGGFGMGGHCLRGGGHGWNSQQAPSNNTSPSSSGNANPTAGETNTPTESQV